MRAEQIKEILEDYKTEICISSKRELNAITNIVEDLIEAEIDYLKEEEPQATKTIDEAEIAQEIVNTLSCIIYNMTDEDFTKMGIL